MTDWPVKTLGEVCELSTGGTPSTGNKAFYDGGQIKWLRSGDVHQREIYDCEGRITEEGMQNANTRYLPLNSVLIALAGQGKTRGTVAMLRTNATCNQSVVSIMPIDTKTLLPEFVFWNLHMKYDEIRRMTGDDGNDRRGLNMRLIRSMAVPIAPLDEQKRIVELLDVATAHVAELTACYEEARAHANNLFTSALRDALESNPDWPVKTLGDICEFQNGYAFKSSEYVKSGHALIRIKNVQQGEIVPSDDVFVLIPKDGSLNQFVLDAGDILMSLTGYLGRVGRLNETDLPAALNQRVAKVSVKSKAPLIDGFLYRLLDSPWFRDQVEVYGRGAAQQNVGTSDISKIEIPVPPLEEQKQLVSRLDSMKSMMTEMVATYDAKLTAAKNLRQSILESAFAGDL
jgi:restriction endonuclease S subunit